MQTDPRVDAYIAKAAAFAQPILTHLRGVVHRVLPDADEGIKWGMPHFMLGGKNVCGMSAFKAHCAFVVHGEGRVGDDAGVGEGKGMGAYGKIASLAELPPDAEIERAVLAAADRVRSGGSAVSGKSKRQPKAEIPLPEDLAAELAKVPAAEAAFTGFAPSHRREYLEWITDAKRPDTRAKRIAQTIEWCAEGKRRNWKYETC